MSEGTHGRAIRVLVVDDHVVVRAGIRALLAEVDDMEVVGEADTGLEAVRKAEELRPDVILMDLVLPGMDGIEATRQITERQPGIRILALTSFSADEKVYPALKAGAVGYLLKDTGPADLVRSIRQAYRGESYLHPRIARKVLKGFYRSGEPDSEAEPLTERETEVLRHVALGLSNQEIAEKLCLSPATVRTHVSNILAKLHVENRVQAAFFALKTGVVRLDDTS